MAFDLRTLIGDSLDAGLHMFLEIRRMTIGFVAFWTEVLLPNVNSLLVASEGIVASETFLTVIALKTTDGFSTFDSWSLVMLS